MNVRAFLAKLGDAMAPERVYRRRLWEERNRYWDALADIASRPLVERNPDGDDQAADTMQLIAREALATARKQETR